MGLSTWNYIFPSALVLSLSKAALIIPFSSFPSKSSRTLNTYYYAPSPTTITDPSENFIDFALALDIIFLKKLMNIY